VSSALAAYDALIVVSELEQITDGISDGEVNVFAYLARLLSLFARDASDVCWGYGFAATQVGAPVSAALTAAIEDLRQSRLIETAGEVNRITARGRGELSLWQSLQRFSGRSRFLRGACGVALLLPTALITDSIGLEPQLKGALVLQSPRALLDEAGRSLLRPHVDGLRAAVGDTLDQMIPAVVWLKYLAQSRLDNAVTAAE